MSRGQSTFKQRDLAAALRAARQAGFWPASIEIDKDGRIVLRIPQHDKAEREPSEWDGAVHT